MRFFRNSCAHVIRGAHRKDDGLTMSGSTSSIKSTHGKTASEAAALARHSRAAPCRRSG